MRFICTFLCFIFAIGGYFLGLHSQKLDQANRTEEKLEYSTLKKLIQNNTGHKLLTLDPNLPSHRDILTHINTCAQMATEHFNRKGSPTENLRRINEASRLFEDFLREQINAHKDFICEIPLDQNQKEKRSGYPDLLIKHLPSETKCYLDPKLFESSSINSSFRSFYYSPHSKTQKIHHDALHLLVGFEHDGKDSQWTFKQHHLVDLSTLTVKLKMEYSASNKILYTKENKKSL